MVERDPGAIVGDVLVTDEITEGLVERLRIKVVSHAWLIVQELRMLVELILIHRHFHEGGSDDGEKHEVLHTGELADGAGDGLFVPE